MADLSIPINSEQGKNNKGRKEAKVTLIE
jgi:hypothetical protein